MPSETHRVLVVEDEMMVAMLLEDMLREAGYDVLGPVMHLDEAVEVAGTASFDLAVLDVNLGGTPSYGVADVLRRRGIPFAFATGYGSVDSGRGHDGVPTLRKPFGAAEIERVMAELGFV